MQGVRNVAALSLVIGYPTTASVPHSLANGFKKLLAVAVGTDYTFKEAEKVSLNVFRILSLSVTKVTGVMI